MGRVVHFEILAEDPQRAVEFYQNALGWKVASWGGPQAYWLVSTGQRAAPGIDGGIMGKHFPQGVINTVEVGSLELAIAAIENAGGRKVHGPNDIPNVGRHAYCADPEGSLFGVLQPFGPPAAAGAEAAAAVKGKTKAKTKAKAKAAAAKKGSGKKKAKKR